jgi:hypothetical protein
MATKTLTNNSDVLRFAVVDDGTISKFVHAYIDGTPQLVFGNGAASTTVGITGGQATAGVWFRTDIFREGNAAAQYYNTVNQATPPTTWTFARRDTAVFTNIDDSMRAGFMIIRATNGTADGYLMYYDDSANTNTWAQGVFTGNPSFATGLDNTGPAVTLVASFNMGGAGAVVADADVRSAVTEVENQRWFDTGAWTYSAVRGAAPNPAASTYQAKASITVGGTGQYFALYAKCTSTGRSQPCSLAAHAIRIPFTP